MNRTDRRIIALAIPALGSLAVEPLYVLVDTAVLGRLGTAQLGGLAIAATVLGLVVAGCNFLTYGTTERVARRLGAGDPTDAADVAVQAMWLSTLVGVVVAPLVFLAAPHVAGWLGASGDVYDFGVTYLRITAVGVPFVVFALGAQGVQRGAADYRTPLVILFASNLVNAALEVLFVFGFDWGVPGSAWSTVIGQVGAGVAFAVVVRRHLAAARHRRPSWAGMAPLLTAGRYLLLRVGSMLAVTSGATAIAARVDAPTLAAHQIAAGMLLFLALALDALAIPAQTLVAEELGQGSTAAAADLSRRCVRLSIITGGAAAIALAALSPILPDAFSGDAAVTERATAALLWLAVMLVPAAIAFAYDGVLIGAGDYRFLGLAALGYLAAIAPIGAVVLLTDGGIGAIWAGLTVWMVLRAAVNHLRATRVRAPPIWAGFVSGRESSRNPGRIPPRCRSGGVSRLLVTGGTGYLGRVVVELSAAAGWAVRGVGSRDLDVRDGSAVASAISTARPDAIVHTAYVRDGADAWPVNVEGSEAIARAVAAVRARLVHVSTDVVFDGRTGRPYREGDPVSPITDYGRSKAEAERRVLAAAPDAVVVRTSLIYGGPGRPPSTHELAVIDPAASFYTDELRCPVQVDDLAVALLELCTLGFAGALHVAGPDGLSRHRFAELITGRPVPGAPAPPDRPLDCRLDTTLATTLLRAPLRPPRSVLRDRPDRADVE